MSYNKEMIHNFIRTFIPALNHAHQYTTSHPHAVTSAHEAYAHLLKAIDRSDDLSLMIIEDRIVIHEKPLEDSPYVGRFVRYFKSLGIEHLCIEQGISLEEMTAFIGLLTTSSRGSWHSTGSFPHIRFGKVGVDDAIDTSEGMDGGKQGGLFEDIQREDFNLMADVYSAVKKGHTLPGSEISRIVNNIITAIQQESSVLLAFSPLRILDEYTFTHSTNVSILNLAQAMALGIEDEALHDIGVAAILHDMGKIFVPEEILNKPGTLTDAEWEVIREHPQKGAEYLLENPGISPLAVVVAYEHHMQYDCSGYPKASKDRQQNLGSQITAISDVFDAMRTKRIYRDAFEAKAIADHMTSLAGTSLNPLLTRNFLLLMQKMHQAPNPQTE